ncbi:MAG: hypothetical protein Q7K57_50680 [Burkholderiaceae bacterium]|nr:hypothetical protein [Burkholderiaceae bacterium]
MTKKPNTGDSERQRRPIASIALGTGGLMGVVILGGLFVASCGSSVNDVDTTVAAPTRAQTKTVAEKHFIFERFEKAVQGVADWGKDETNETKLERVTAEIEKARRPFNVSAFGDGNAEARASLAANLARQASLRETIRLERERTKSEVHPKDLPETSPVPKLALMAPKPLNAMVQAAMPDAPMPVDLYRFALNALLLPLLDDSIPPQWTDAAIDFSCEPGTSVTVDGEPLVAGKLIPATAFTVRWNMDRCTPMGPESVALSGSVELLVFHEDAGLSAVVMPDRLRVDSHMGRAWLRGPFAAETSLATSATDSEPRAAKVPHQISKRTDSF